MIIKNHKIVEITESELFEHYLKSGYDEIYSFSDYKQRCEAHGTKVITKTRKRNNNEQAKPS